MGGKSDFPGLHYKQEEDAEKELLAQVKREANPTAGERGRPALARRKREMMRKLNAGTVEEIDRPWLLSELLRVYGMSGIRPNDKLRALELMSRISGYGGKEIVPDDERRAIEDLMQEMDGRYDE